MNFDEILISCSIIFLLLFLESKYRKNTDKKKPEKVKVYGVYTTCKSCGSNNVNGEHVDGVPIENIVSSVNYDGIDASYCPVCYEVTIGNQKLFDEITHGLTEEICVQIIKNLECRSKYFELTGCVSGKVFVESLLSSAANNPDELKDLLNGIYTRAILEPGETLDKRIDSAIISACQYAIK